MATDILDMPTAEDETSEQNVETQAADETPAETKGKRKRVDVAALAAQNPNEKVVLTLHIPAGLKVKIKETADGQDVSEAEFVRNLLGKELSYEIPAEFNERKRGRAGMSEEEKEKQNATKRDNVNKILAAVAAGAIDPELLKSLGVDPANLPKPRSVKKEEEAAA